MPALPMRLAAVLVGLAAAAVALADSAAAQRVKDIASVQGVRTNQLVGYGLVVGLDGSGDQTSQAPFTIQSLNNWLKQLGITLPAGTNPQLKNIAAVSVHAELPPFVKTGQTIDVTVSSIGNAKSLRGGSLLVTPLRGLDGQVYAIAQGNLIVNGFGAQANDGSKVTVNVPTSGRVPNGATVEKVVPSTFADGSTLTLSLHTADFTTATRLAARVNKEFGADTAAPLDSVSVTVRAPADAGQRVAFLSALENLDVDPGEASARVIINSRTGTVVIGDHVRVTPAAVSHGSLTVTIKEEQKVSQPTPFSSGRADRHGARLGDRRAAEGEPDVPVRAGRVARRDRPRRQPGRCGARRPRRHPRGAAAGGRAARPADRHLGPP